MPNLWDRQDGETPKAFAAFCLYRDLPAIDRSVLAAREGHQKDTKGTLRQWKGWSMRNDWVNRAAEHDSDLASRRRIRRGDALERAQDDIANMSRAALAKLLPLLQRRVAETSPVGAAMVSDGDTVDATGDRRVGGFSAPMYRMDIPLATNR